MSWVRAFCSDQRGGSAAEFAMVVPIFLLFLLGMIDVGRYAWALNEAQKATQVGTRWAVATELIPTGLAEYSFAIEGLIPQGEPIPQSAFPGVRCTSTEGVVSCQCMTEVDDTITGSCDFPMSANQAAFDQLAIRIATIWPVDPDNIEIDYGYSGLGYAGTPALPPENSGDDPVPVPDVSPLVTVRLRNMGFPLFFLLGQTVPLPSFAYSLTMEDAEGAFAHY